LELADNLNQRRLHVKIPSQPLVKLGGCFDFAAVADERLALALEGGPNLQQFALQPFLFPDGTPGKLLDFLSPPIWGHDIFSHSQRREFKPITAGKVAKVRDKSVNVSVLFFHGMN
jgi:hypothetical protein